MKFSRHLLGLVLLTGLCSFPLAPLWAQSQSLAVNRALISKGPPASPPTAQGSRKLQIDATATIDVGLPQLVAVKSAGGIFARVGLRHDQTVDVAIQYPVVRAGHSITAEPLDGGQVIAPVKNLIVGVDGTIHFKFRAGHNVGVYQVALHDGAQELGIQFWVLDEEHPERNPPVVNSGK